MIDTKDFYSTLIKNSFDYFVGVPDSLLKEFCLCINDLSKTNHIITANEGNAIAIASGYNIATSKYGSKGSEVTTIQTKLKRWGYYAGAIDGIYGGQTVIHFYH